MPARRATRNPEGERNAGEESLSRVGCGILRSIDKLGDFAEQALGLAPEAVVGENAGVDTFQEGQAIWVEQSDGSQRAGIFVGEATQAWFGGVPGAYVVYPDTRDGEEVSMMRVVAREDST